MNEKRAFFYKYNNKTMFIQNVDIPNCSPGEKYISQPYLILFLFPFFSANLNELLLYYFFSFRHVGG